MPFDFDSLLREHRVHVEPPQEPPQPPERGGEGPRRIHINIEIVERRPTPKPRSHRFGTVTLALLIVALLAALAGCTAAHAQPTSWQSYREGFVTRHQGNDRDGGQWSGTSYKQSFTTYFDATGPHGQTQHCRSWQQGWQTFTECD